MSTSRVTGSWQPGMPTGLYDPEAERDSCGFAFVATLRGTPGRDIVDAGLTALLNLDHRGAVGSEVDSGDGVHGRSSQPKNGREVDEHIDAEPENGHHGPHHGPHGPYSARGTAPVSY